jgi:hypothetical protein
LVGDTAKAEEARTFFLAADKVVSDLKNIAKNPLESLINFGRTRKIWSFIN